MGRDRDHRNIYLISFDDRREVFYVKHIDAAQLVAYSLRIDVKQSSNFEGGLMQLIVIRKGQAETPAPDDPHTVENIQSEDLPQIGA